MKSAEYKHLEIEEKWRSHWYEDNIYEAIDFSKKPKKYILAELPYPSGKYLHAGHMMRYTVPEVYSRFLRMQGYNVLFPMGWDCFGLPAETFAIKTKTTPQKAIAQAIKDYKFAMQRMGYAIDWSREIDTSSQEFYKWTQWMFLKLYEQGLVERRQLPVWWCKALGVLADEEVLTKPDGTKVSERDGHPVEHKMVSQWVLKITDYADRLIADLDKTDYLDYVKHGQINWIGRKEGALVKFDSSLGETFEVFTTRPDTLYGVTFVAICPEHPLMGKILEKAGNREEIEKYNTNAGNLSDVERLSKIKSGVKVAGVTIKHPLTNGDLPLFIADYVLVDYGTGVVMGVPAHDTRDFEFAQSHNLSIKQVLRSPEVAIFVHGWGSTHETGFFKELASKLYADGYTIVAPDLPSTDSPVYEDWVAVLSKAIQDYSTHNITLIGHSSGGYLALKLAEKFKIKRLLAVSPCSPTAHWNDARHQLVKDWLGNSRTYEIYKSFHSAEVDLSLLKQNVEHLHILFGDNDPYILEAEQVYYSSKVSKDSMAHLPFGHMGEEDGSKPMTSISAYIPIEQLPYLGEGRVTNSGEENEGKISSNFGLEIVALLEKQGKGGPKTTYKLRDTIWSRQRYWGEPIPLLYTETGTIEEDFRLPVTLPEITDFDEARNEFPILSEFPEWVHTTNENGDPRTRETDVMPTWAGSNWYYIRYLDPHNDNEFARMDKMKYWLPVDNYFGDAGHTTAHLMYTRFWYKALFDQGYMPYEEPIKWRMSGGILLGEDKRKMSKSRPEYSVNPQDLMENYGADATRMVLCFLGPYSETYPWNSNSIRACYKVIETIYSLQEKVSAEFSDVLLTQAFNRMVKKVTLMLDTLKMNTAVSEIMIFVNQCKKADNIDLEMWKDFIKVLAPITPFVAEDLWYKANGWSTWEKSKSVHLQSWPQYDAALAEGQNFELPVQINGKTRAIITVPISSSQDDVVELAFESADVSKYCSKTNVKKIIYVENKILNLII